MTCCDVSRDVVVCEHSVTHVGSPCLILVFVCVTESVPVRACCVFGGLSVTMKARGRGRLGPGVLLRTSPCYCEEFVG